MKPCLIFLLLFTFLNSKAFHDVYSIELDTISVDTIIITDVDCKGEATGSIDISILGGKEPFTYLWSTEDSTAVIGNLFAGEYIVTISDALDSLLVVDFVVEEPAKALQISSVYSRVDCSQYYNVLLSSSGGGNYHEYSFSKSSQSEIFGSSPHFTTQDFGTYYCKVKDSNGCVAVETLNVQFICSFNGHAVVTNESCPGANNGAISISPSGCLGNGPSEFWLSPYDNVANGASPNFPNLSAGSYRLYAASGNCSFSINEIIVGSNSSGIKSELISKTNIDCNNDYGEIEVEFEGGVPPYEIWWSNNERENSIDSLDAGIYSYTITDQKDCRLNETYEILPRPRIPSDETINNLCPYDQLPIQLSSAVIPDDSIFDVDWFNEIGEKISDSNSVDLVVSATETFFVSILDSISGCQYYDSLSIVIHDADIDKFSMELVSLLHQDCTNEFGEILFEPIGGVAPYEFNWNSGNNTNLADSLVAGNYTLEVIDSKGCTITDTIEILERPSLVTDIILNRGVCESNPDSISIELAITPDYGYLTTQWSDQYGNITADTNQINVRVDSTTMFYVAFYDTITSCQYLDSIQVNQNEFYAYNTVISNPVIIPSSAMENNGSVDPVITEGTPPYEYKWNTGSVEPIIENVGPKSYLLMVFDSLNCRNTFVYKVEEIPEVTSVDETFNQVLISPNPTSNEVKIDAPFDFVQLVGINGEVILDHDLKNHQAILSVRSLPSGIYFIQLTSKSGATFSQKIVVNTD